MGKASWSDIPTPSEQSWLIYGMAPSNHGRFASITASTLIFNANQDCELTDKDTQLEAPMTSSADSSGFPESPSESFPSPGYINSASHIVSSEPSKTRRMTATVSNHDRMPPTIPKIHVQKKRDRTTTKAERRKPFPISLGERKFWTDPLIST